MNIIWYHIRMNEKLLNLTTELKAEIESSPEVKELERLNKLLNEDDDISENVTAENAENIGNTNTAQDGEEVAQDDFDYSDFEIEDDNI